jgi:hypothetical protein
MMDSNAAEGSQHRHPNVRIWLLADALGNGDLCLLYPQKRTF